MIITKIAAKIAPESKAKIEANVFANCINPIKHLCMHGHSQHFSSDLADNTFYIIQFT